MHNVAAHHISMLHARDVLEITIMTVAGRFASSLAVSARERAGIPWGHRLLYATGIELWKADALRSFLLDAHVSKLV